MLIDEAMKSNSLMRGGVKEEEEEEVAGAGMTVTVGPEVTVLVVVPGIPLESVLCDDDVGLAEAVAGTLKPQ